jgi:hypothetical protein
MTDFIDATDLNFNTGSGGLGLGAPSFTGSPAPGTDIMPGATIGSAGQAVGPVFNTGSNLGSNPIGTPQASYAAQAPSSPTTSTDPSLNVGTPAGSFSLTDTGNLFARGFVILAGLVFLGVGLNMLRPGSVPIGNPARAA